MKKNFLKPHTIAGGTDMHAPATSECPAKARLPSAPVAGCISNRAVSAGSAELF